MPVNPPYRPDISLFPSDIQLMVLVAETQGFRWIPYEWWDDRTVPLLWRDDLGTPYGDDFDWLDRGGSRKGDAAHGIAPWRWEGWIAWSDLLEKELTGIEKAGRWRAWSGDAYSGRVFGEGSADIQTAVWTAVLAKHDVGVPK